MRQNSIAPQTDGKLKTETNKGQEIFDKSVRSDSRDRERKRLRREEIARSRTYQASKLIRTYMDDYYIDPILGLFFPGLGDLLTSVLTLPLLRLALFRIKSIPLTLAIIYNVLVDVFLGMLPLWIGDIIDLFNKSFKENHALVVGFVEEDQEMIRRVNRRAVYCAIMIGILIFLIYQLFLLGQMLVSWFLDLF